MDDFIEMLAYFLLSPLLSVLGEKPGEELDSSRGLAKLPKACRILIFVLFCLVLLSMWLLIIFGAIMLAAPKTDGDRSAGKICLAIGLSMLAAYIVYFIVFLNTKHRREREKLVRERQGGAGTDRTALSKPVHVVIDRPLGSVHPEHDDIVYELNYGFVPDSTGGDGEAQDAYVIGVDEVVSEFDGVVVAIIHRLNDEEDKWVVAPRGYEASDEEIIEKTAFQEKYFEIELIRH